MATASGTVKKTALTDFSRQRSVGLRALELEEGDVLVGTAITDGNCDVMLLSSEGKAVRFKEADVRAMGRTARGVRGIKLGTGHQMISLIIPQDGGRVLTVSENGYGKRTEMIEFPTKGRGTKGVIAMQTSERNGRIVGAVQVFDGDELMLISNQGTLVRTRADEISVLGRNTQGVRVIRTKGGEHLVGVERVDEPADEEEFESGDDSAG
jgi:DNA gyrase subunit A